MKRHCFALDLIPDPELIKKYKKYHEKIWPEITLSLKDSGINKMEIWMVENRLFMIVDTEDDFSFKQKLAADLKNPKVMEWEKLMWQYQQALPSARSGEKWIKMEKIFDLDEQ